jgi:ABC-2 type transport system permease protein
MSRRTTVTPLVPPALVPPAGEPAPHDVLQRIHRRPHWIRGSLTDLLDIWAYRDLLNQLIRKELKVKYKDSVLGFFWSTGRPLFQLLIYYVAFTIFLGNRQPAYAIFIFSGLIVWQTFTDIVGGCTGCIVGNGGLIKKVYCPREVFPLSIVGASVINFGFQLIVLAGALAIAALGGSHVVVTPDLALTPLALVVCVVWATALGLLLAATTVYLRDLQHLIDIVLLAWFWLTPIVYPITQPINQFAKRGDHTLLTVYLLNPMTNVVATFQRAFYTMGEKYTFQGSLFIRLLVLLLVGLVVTWVCQRLFARLQGNFAQEL